MGQRSAITVQWVLAWSLDSAELPDGVWLCAFLFANAALEHGSAALNQFSIVTANAPSGPIPNHEPSHAAQYLWLSGAFTRARRLAWMICMAWPLKT